MTENRPARGQPFPREEANIIVGGINNMWTRLPQEDKEQLTLHLLDSSAVGREIVRGSLGYIPGHMFKFSGPFQEEPSDLQNKREETDTQIVEERIKEIASSLRQLSSVRQEQVMRDFVLDTRIGHTVQSLGYIPYIPGHMYKLRRV